MSEPTKGPWNVDHESEDPSYAGHHIVISNDELIIAVVPICDTPGEADAELIAEAGTVYHATGMRPAEMAERILEMTALLEEWEDYSLVPAASCSCHLDAPCSDCTDYAAERDLLERTRALLTKDKGKTCDACGDTGISPALVDTPAGPAYCPYIGEPCEECGGEKAKGKEEG